MKNHRLVLGVVCCLALVLIAGASANRQASRAKQAISPIPAFSSTDLSATPAENWIGVHGNNFLQQYSGLTQINRATVKNLKIAWHSEVTIPTKGKPNYTGVNAEDEPVEYNGTMYIPDGKGNVYAIDATTGERLWYYKYSLPKGATPLLQVTRGLAIGDGLVYVPESSGTVAALDQATGRVKWTKQLADYKNGATLSAAPTYIDGMVIEGISGGDGGYPCAEVALDAKTGHTIWRFNVIPTANQPGGNTWGTPRQWFGGGAIWNTPAIDTKLGQVYFSVGNPVPYNGASRPPGDELYTESIMGLNLKTGKLKWYFQEVRHDIWDYDAAANGVELFDLNIKGQMRHAIAQAGKTGWVYILDRANGKPILGMNQVKVPQNVAQNTAATQPIPVGQPFATQCAPKAWAKWKAPDGNPVTVGCLFQPYNDSSFTAFAPSALGGADWPPTSFSQRTGYLYICSKNSSSAWKALPPAKPGTLKPLGNFFQIDGLFGQGKSPGSYPTGTVVAMNMRTNNRAWTASFPVGDMCYSGILTTQGGLVFVGRTGGYLQAYNDMNGKLLWTSPKLAAGANAAAMTYSVNGKQYVAIYAGGNSLASGFSASGPKNVPGSELYAFALPS
jgi:PQQ-dependent dehydrogenase (methanol/ethanol family)